MRKIIKKIYLFLFKKTFYEKAASIKNIFIESFRNTSFFIKRKYRRLVKKNKNKNFISIGMLAIRKQIYVDLAINSINSLHFYNPNHEVLLYLDQNNMMYFKEKQRKLDYPQKVKPLFIEDPTNQPWQFTKLKVILDLSKKNIPFVDADSIWHDDIINYLTDTPTFLVIVNKICDRENEKRLITLLNNNKKWLQYYHFNVGFVYIPSKNYSESFQDFCNNMINQIKLLADQKEIDPSTFRLCEEITLSIAAQECFPIIKTLKESDGPGNKYILESLYYGCIHGVY